MLYIVLPVYNEEENIAHLLNQIRDSLSFVSYKLIIVDDGSRDRSRPRIHSFESKIPIELIIHPRNLGLARTLEDGLRRAAEVAAPGDVIVTMDADNTHHPRLIKLMLAEIARGSDVVVASRFVSGGGQRGVSHIRRFLSRGANSLVGLFFPLRGVGDYTSGFRAYRGGILKKLFSVYGDKTIKARTFAVSGELLVKLRRLGAKFSAVPLVLRYDQKRGKSKIKIIPTILEYLEIILREIGGQVLH